MPLDLLVNQDVVENKEHLELAEIEEQMDYEVMTVEMGRLEKLEIPDHKGHPEFLELRDNLVDQDEPVMKVNEDQLDQEDQPDVLEHLVNQVQMASQDQSDNPVMRDQQEIREHKDHKEKMDHQDSSDQTVTPELTESKENVVLLDDKEIWDQWELLEVLDIEDDRVAEDVAERLAPTVFQDHKVHLEPLV